MPTSDEPNEGSLTAWERWELASFDSPQSHATAPGASTDETTQSDIAAAQGEIERLRQQAQEAGRTAGYSAGYSAGYAEGQIKARTEATRFAGMAAQLEAALNEFDQQVSDDVLALALEVARQVVRQSLAVKPELLLETLRQALAQMPHPHTTISVNPEDASLLRSYLGDQLAHAGHRLHEDPRIQRGGCIVEAGGSQIDATVATRWKRIVESLGCTTEWLASDPPPQNSDDGRG